MQYKYKYLICLLPVILIAVVCTKMEAEVGSGLPEGHDNAESEQTTAPTEESRDTSIGDASSAASTTTVASRKELEDRVFLLESQLTETEADLKNLESLRLRGGGSDPERSARLATLERGIRQRAEILRQDIKRTNEDLARLPAVESQAVWQPVEIIITPDSPESLPAGDARPSLVSRIPEIFLEDEDWLTEPLNAQISLKDLEAKYDEYKKAAEATVID